MGTSATYLRAIWLKKPIRPSGAHCLIPVFERKPRIISVHSAVGRERPDLSGTPLMGSIVRVGRTRARGWSIRGSPIGTRLAKPARRSLESVCMALFGAPTYGSLYPIPTVRRHAYIYAYRIAYLYIYERACKWLAHVRRASNRDLRLYRTPEMLKRDALDSPEDEDTVCDLKQMCAIREVILSFEKRTFVRSTCN